MKTSLPKGPGAKDHPDQFTVMLEMPRGRLLHFDAITNWLICGPLQDEKRVSLRYSEKDVQAVAATTDAAFPSIGLTALIAICRAVVASILANQVFVPTELLRKVA